MTYSYVTCLSHALPPSFICFLSLTHTHRLSVSLAQHDLVKRHTHTHTLSLSMSRTLSRMLSYSLLVSHKHSLHLSRSPRMTEDPLPHTHTLALSLSRSLRLSCLPRTTGAAKSGMQLRHTTSPREEPTGTHLHTYVYIYTCISTQT